MFPCVFSKIFQDNFFAERLRVPASDGQDCFHWWVNFRRYIGLYLGVWKNLDFSKLQQYLSLDQSFNCTTSYLKPILKVVTWPRCFVQFLKHDWSVWKTTQNMTVITKAFSLCYRRDLHTVPQAVFLFWVLNLGAYCATYLKILL